MRKSERGFTLFEVLGAVSLLAIVFMVLATTAMRGLRSEGESQRIFRASLLADWELTEFEAKLNEGLIPELGTTEGLEGDEFTITWEVTPLEPPLLLEGAVFNSRQDNSIFDAIFTPKNNRDPAFVQIQLTVSWFEGTHERSITRTTFAVDQNAATEQAIQPGKLSVNPNPVSDSNSGDE